MSEETCPAMNFATPIRRMLAIVILTIGPASPWAMASVSRGNHAIGDHSPVHSIRVAARDTAQIDSTSHRKMRRSTQSIKKPWYERFDDKVDAFGCKLNRNLHQGCDPNPPERGYNNQ